MRRLYLLLILMPLLLPACQGSEEHHPDSAKYPTATGDGAMRAHLDDIDEQVERATKDRSQHQVHRLDMSGRSAISTAYAYWDYLEIFYNEQGLQSAVLTGRPAKGNRKEEFIFGDEGQLIFARFRPAADSGTTSPQRWEMYFIKEKLVRVRDENGERLSVKNDSLKTQAIKMIREAQSIREFMAQKNLKD